MRHNCPDDAVLLAVAEDRLDPTAAATRAHVASCKSCEAAVAELRDLGAQIAALGHAERAALPANFATRLDARLARPGIAARLPLRVAAACREVGALLQPAVAGSAVAAVLGLAIGTWIGITTQRAPSEAVATDLYDVSTLVDDTSTGLASDYFATTESNANGSTTANGTTTTTDPKASANRSTDTNASTSTTDPKTSAGAIDARGGASSTRDATAAPRDSQGGAR